KSDAPFTTDVFSHESKILPPRFSFRLLGIRDDALLRQPARRIAEREARRPDSHLGRSGAARQRIARRPALGRNESAAALAGSRRSLGFAHATGDSRAGIH